MRIVLLMILVASVASLHAQTQLPFNAMDNTQSLQFHHYRGLGNGNTLNKKWSLSTFRSISGGFGFFNGNYTSFVSAPMTLQLNRRLNNNVYAFAAITAAPTYFNFNTFSNSSLNKGFGNKTMLNSNSFGMYSSVGAGFMYINDEKTFSISGSISVYRGLYSTYPYGNMNPGQHYQQIDNRQ